MDSITNGLASARQQADHDDRRQHRRVAYSQLPEPARIRIANRPAISLVDLSPGGALLELPFQMLPDSRVTLELSTSVEQLAVPFRLLRCYVAELRDGVRYHAAGTFDQILKLPATLADALRPSTSQRLIASLEALLRNSLATNVETRGIRFNDMLSWALAGLRRGEPASLVVIQIKAQMARLWPSLAVVPASVFLTKKDEATTARFFGLDFRSGVVFTAADRRFLRAGAQLITMINKNAEYEVIQQVAPHSIIRTLAEWQALTR